MLTWSKSIEWIKPRAYAKVAALSVTAPVPSEPPTKSANATTWSAAMTPKVIPTRVRNGLASRACEESRLIAELMTMNVTTKCAWLGRFVTEYLGHMVDRAGSSRAAAQAVGQTAGEMPHWDNIFELFADPTRLRLLVAIHAAPGASVSDLAAATGMAANAVTKSLKVLQGFGVVDSAKDGRFRRWELTSQGAHEMLHHIGAPHTDLHPPH